MYFCISFHSKHEHCINHCFCLLQVPELPALDEEEEDEEEDEDELPDLHARQPTQPQPKRQKRKNIVDEAILTVVDRISGRKSAAEELQTVVRGRINPRQAYCNYLAADAMTLSEENWQTFQTESLRLLLSLRTIPPPQPQPRPQGQQPPQPQYQGRPQGRPHQPQPGQFTHPVRTPAASTSTYTQQDNIPTPQPWQSPQAMSTISGWFADDTQQGQQGEGSSSSYTADYQQL